MDTIHERNFRTTVDRVTQLSTFIDNWLITASLGSFGLSFAFIKGISGEIVNIELMYLAWLGFVLSVIGLILNSALLVYTNSLVLKETNRVRREGKKQGINTNEQPPLVKTLARVINFLNYFAIVVFILSLIFALIFAIKNVDNQIKNQEQKTKEVPTIVNNYYHYSSESDFGDK